MQAHATTIRWKPGQPWTHDQGSEPEPECWRGKLLHFATREPGPNEALRIYYVNPKGETQYCNLRRWRRSCKRNNKAHIDPRTNTPNYR